MVDSFLPVCRVAAIDIGTVTCRMLVADVDAQGGMRELCREYAIANLGEGVDATHRLKPQAIERVAGIVKRYLAKLELLNDAVHNPFSLKPRIVALATSASRDAENAADFTNRMRDLGVDVRVIPGELEAALSFSGATAEFPGESAVVVDVGGGSTEVVAGRSGNAPVLAKSFDIGCRRMTERFLKTDIPTKAEIEVARTWVRDQMAPYFAELHSHGFTGARMVAVAGTATTVVSIREAMETYDSSCVHKARVTRGQLDDIASCLGSQPLATRRQTVGLVPHLRRHGVGNDHHLRCDFLRIVRHAHGRNQKRSESSKRLRRPGN